MQLKAALTGLLEQPGAEAPRQCRFFRGQMQTIISRSLQDLDIAPVPSRRCFTLISKLLWFSSNSRHAEHQQHHTSYARCTTFMHVPVRRGPLQELNQPLVLNEMYLLLLANLAPLTWTH